MDLTNLNVIQSLCKKYHIQPNDRLGQNFLVDKSVLNRIIETANIQPDEIILEVGPGFGVLTKELAKRAKKVIAVEIEKKFVQILQDQFIAYKNVEIVFENILELQVTSYPPTGDHPKGDKLQEYKIVSNLPYNITSHFLKEFLTSENKPKAMTLMLQKEVAQRICAHPGKKSLLSISVQLFGKPNIITLVSKKSFWPMPDVDSALLDISDIKSNPEIEKILHPVSIKDFFQLLRISFSSKRKQLQNNLSSGFHIKKKLSQEYLLRCGFQPAIRAQELSLEQWITLANIIFPDLPHKLKE